jgi:hypothetical protein
MWGVQLATVMTSIHVLDFNLFSPLGADANLGLLWIMNCQKQNLAVHTKANLVSNVKF